MHLGQVLCFAIFAAAVVASAVIQEVVRAQLVDRLYAGQRISWRDFRNLSDWFGQGGMWSLHRQYFPRSRLRFWFAASFVAMFVGFTLGSVLQAYGVR